MACCLGTPSNSTRFSQAHLQKWSVRIIQCFHKVPSIGYAVSEIRQKLKPEYVGRSGVELAQLRKAGEQISQEVSLPKFVFLGDTSTQVFNDEVLVTDAQSIFEFPHVICECTWLFGADELVRTAVDGHVHWEQLWPIIKAHPNTHFILTHFSHRYTVPEIVEFLDSACDNLEISNVTIFAGHNTRP
jgi:ribonuclease Z